MVRCRLPTYLISQCPILPLPDRTHHCTIHSGQWHLTSHSWCSGVKLLGSSNNFSRPNSIYPVCWLYRVLWSNLSPTFGQITPVEIVILIKKAITRARHGWILKYCRRSVFDISVGFCCTKSISVCSFPILLCVRSLFICDAYVYVRTAACVCF